MPTHVVLNGRYLNVGRTFPNLIFMKLRLEEGEGSSEKERVSFEEQNVRFFFSLDF